MRQATINLKQVADQRGVKWTTSLERNDLATGLNGRGSAPVLSRPHVEMDEKAGTLRVNDARLLNKDRRTFCRRLIQAVARRQGIRKTMIDLASASCRVEFVPARPTCTPWRQSSPTRFARQARPRSTATARPGGSHPPTGSL